MPSEQPSDEHETSHPVSVEFFSGALRMLQRLHGDRRCGPLEEPMREHLAMAEILYKQHEPVEPKPKEKKGGE